MSRGLRFAGWIAQADGRSDLALRFLGAAEAEHRRIGYVDPPFDAARSAQAVTEVRESLSDAERITATRDAEGAPFPTILDEAVDYLHEVVEGTK